MSGTVGKPQSTMFTMFLESLLIKPQSLKSVDLENSREVRDAAQESIINLMNKIRSKGDASCLKGRISEATSYLENLGRHHPGSPEFQAASTIADYLSAHTSKTLPRKFKGKSELLPRLKAFKNAGQPAAVTAS